MHEESGGTLRNVVPGWARRTLLACLPLTAGLLVTVPSAQAQTDYYNLDAGRPVRIEDAYATERYAFELKLAPVRLERSRGGVYHWGVEPEIAYGILPRTHIELGLPLAVLDAGAGGEAGVAGFELAVLHNLNTETRSLAALGLRVDALLPVGRFGPERVYASLTALATRTWRIARVHLNAQYTAGRAPADRTTSAGETTAGVSRWLAGVAVDHAFPLEAMLLVADVTARQPIDADGAVEWAAGAGVRYQWSPRLALDAGVGRTLNGGRAWSITFGTAWAFGLRGLIAEVGR